MRRVEQPPQVRQAQDLSGEFCADRKATLQNAIRDLSAQALKVWFILGDFARQQHEKKTKMTWEVCWPAVPTIAKLAGMSDRTVQRCLKELLAARWIGLHRRTMRSNFYYFPQGLPSTRKWYAYAVMGASKYDAGGEPEL
jgi:hypothetical protein